jgi:hypothetical protein
VKPPYGPKADAVLHGTLVALDFMTSLQEWSGRPAEVFLDTVSLDDQENPVNLNMHHHEELIGRTTAELENYDSIMSQRSSRRVDSLRDWYRRCIKQRRDTAAKNDSTVKDLEFESLCTSIKTAKTVTFFGGSSFGLLQRLINRGAVSNIECYQQAVRCPTPLLEIRHLT